ncbi:MAG: hypothetical protein WAM73_08565 [Desulfobacterales bacterium]
MVGCWSGESWKNGVLESWDDDMVEVKDWSDGTSGSGTMENWSIGTLEPRMFPALAPINQSRQHSIIPGFQLSCISASQQFLPVFQHSNIPMSSILIISGSGPENRVFC